jgi:hypothetical protein
MEIPFESLDSREIFGGIERKIVNLRPAKPDRDYVLNAMSRHPPKYIFKMVWIHFNEMV